MLPPDPIDYRELSVLRRRRLPDGQEEAVFQWRPEDPDPEWNRFHVYLGDFVRNCIYRPGPELADVLVSYWMNEDEGLRTGEITHYDEARLGLSEDFVGYDFTIRWTPVNRCPFCGSTECCGMEEAC